MLSTGLSRGGRGRAASRQLPAKSPERRAEEPRLPDPAQRRGPGQPAARRAGHAPRTSATGCACRRFARAAPCRDAAAQRPAESRRCRRSCTRTTHCSRSTSPRASPSTAAAASPSASSSGCAARGRSARFLELVHRLDRDTSGVLLVAKKRVGADRAARALREGRVDKRYFALVRGQLARRASGWSSCALDTFVTAEGERRVRVDAAGPRSRAPCSGWPQVADADPPVALLDAELETGRTHQIRVHLTHLGFPLAGDDKYGDFAWNKALARQGLKRMFLHAHRIGFAHPVDRRRDRHRVAAAARTSPVRRDGSTPPSDAPADAVSRRRGDFASSSSTGTARWSTRPR